MTDADIWPRLPPTLFQKGGMLAVGLSFEEARKFYDFPESLLLEVESGLMVSLQLESHLRSLLFHITPKTTLLHVLNIATRMQSLY